MAELSEPAMEKGAESIVAGGKMADLEADGKMVDLEAGESGGGPAAPYPKMAEDPRLRWAFIRKVYAVVVAQLLFTAGFSAVFMFVRPVEAFLLSGAIPYWVLFLILLSLPLIMMGPMFYYRKRHPWNLLLLALYTLCISLSVGMACILVSGKIVLQSLILTTTIFVSLTLYTFWAARRGHDFFFLCPYIFASLFVLLAYLSIQIYFRLGNVVQTIYGCVATVVFSGCIIFDTDNLIKRHAYDEFVPAAISLYLSVMNLFMSILGFSVSVN